MRLFEDQHTNLGSAGRGSKEIYCIQCSGRPGTKVRYVNPESRAPQEWSSVVVLNVHGSTGIKEYSDWPTIPQLYINQEFVGGCDILISMHQNGELANLLEEKGVLVEADGEAGHNT